MCAADNTLILNYDNDGIFISEIASKFSALESYTILMESKNKLNMMLG